MSTAACAAAVPLLRIVSAAARRRRFVHVETGHARRALRSGAEGDRFANTRSGADDGDDLAFESKQISAC